jgi:2-oxoglutarate ferredoxin oxidoreductase subunit beta
MGHEQVIEIPKYSRKDFTSDQTVRWCPGCADYSILAQVQRVMPTICEEVKVKRENIVFISGIGCAARFPYYMDTYGFHTIHGRAPTFASGLRAVRNDLMVWVVTGDGDALSIGGNHFIHALRRNINLKILLFNNQIYGLTKGQYSPTSEIGKRTKSSPMGSIEQPINPLVTALAAEATFVARSIATDSTHMQDMLLRAAKHNGSAIVEILQNCPVFNDGCFDSFSERKVRAEKMIELKHGEQMAFGADGEYGLTVSTEGGGLQIRTAKRAEADESQLLVHDESSPSTALASMLARLETPDYPVPIGVFRSIRQPTYEEMLEDQIVEAKGAHGKADMQKLLGGGETWEVS